MRAEPASVGIRVLAALIDMVPLLVLFLVLAKTVGTWETGNGGTRIELHNGAFLLYLLLIFVYFVIFELAFAKSLGKIVCGLRVVDVNGGEASTGQILGRNLVRFVDFLPVFYLVGFVSAAANERNARVGDLAAKTAVVRG